MSEWVGDPEVIEVTPGAPFEAALQAWHGLLATLRFSLIDKTDGSVEIAETGAGITEPVSGLYVFKGTAPTVEDRYTIVWTGIEEGAPAAQELWVTTLPALRPTVSAVAKLLRARTRGAGGLSPGTFDATTKPTGEQVDELIDTASDSILPALPNKPVPVDFHASARWLVAIKAAMLVELSYFPEQTAGDRSVYTNLRDLLRDEMKVTVKAMNDAADGTADGATGMPSHTFPPCSTPMEW